MNKDKDNTIRIPYQEMEREFYRILEKYGFTSGNARTCAGIFAENSLDGVITHGLNRFAGFIEFVKKKYIIANNEPKLISSAGAIEQWDGQLGAGPSNAMISTERAMRLAHKFVIGCVGLSNTNHWMRGSSYGWKAAKAGFAFIGWTNTIANMPAWGAIDVRLGNNPLVLGVPFESEAIVLDMAMSQYSYGMLEVFHSKKQQLPFPGGFNKQGKLTKQPSEILESQRALPIGYWKGSGLALLLDLFATILSGGLSSAQISERQDEYGVSQVFIAIDISKLKNFPAISEAINGIIQDYRDSIPEAEDKEILYPGQRVLTRRKENLSKGIPVSKDIWAKIKEL